MTDRKAKSRLENLVHHYCSAIRDNDHHLMHALYPLLSKNTEYLKLQDNIREEGTLSFNGQITAAIFNLLSNFPTDPSAEDKAEFYGTLHELRRLRKPEAAEFFVAVIFQLLSRDTLTKELHAILREFDPTSIVYRNLPNIANVHMLSEHSLPALINFLSFLKHEFNTADDFFTEYQKRISVCFAPAELRRCFDDPDLLLLSVSRLLDSWNKNLSPDLVSDIVRDAMLPEIVCRTSMFCTLHEKSISLILQHVSVQDLLERMVKSPTLYTIDLITKRFQTLDFSSECISSEKLTDILVQCINFGHFDLFEYALKYGAIVDGQCDALKVRDATRVESYLVAASFFEKVPKSCSDFLNLAEQLQVSLGTESVRVSESFQVPTIPARRAKI